MFRVSLQRLQFRGLKDFRKNLGNTIEKDENLGTKVKGGSIVESFISGLDYLLKPWAFVFLLSGSGAMILFAKTLDSDKENKSRQNN